MGDVLSAQGDLTAALAAYRASLEIRERLAAADPGNAGWQRDLSVSQDKSATCSEDAGGPGSRAGRLPGESGNQRAAGGGRPGQRRLATRPLGQPYQTGRRAQRRGT